MVFVGVGHQSSVCPFTRAIGPWTAECEWEWFSQHLSVRFGGIVSGYLKLRHQSMVAIRGSRGLKFLSRSVIPISGLALQEAHGRSGQDRRRLAHAWSWSAKGSALKGQAYVQRMGSCWPVCRRGGLPLLAAIAVSLWMLHRNCAMADPASAPRGLGRRGGTPSASPSPDALARYIADVTELATRCWGGEDRCHQALGVSAFRYWNSIVETSLQGSGYDFSQMPDKDEREAGLRRMDGGAYGVKGLETMLRPTTSREPMATVTVAWTCRPRTTLCRCDRRVQGSTRTASPTAADMAMLESSWRRLARRLTPAGHRRQRLPGRVHPPTHISATRASRSPSTMPAGRVIRACALGGSPCSTPPSARWTPT